MLTAAVLLAVLVGAAAQSVTGLGFSLVCAPLLVALLGPYEGVRLVMVLGVLLTVVLLVRLRRDVEPRRAALLLLPALVATPVVARLARGLPERPAAAVAGAVALTGTVLLAGGVRWRAARGRAGLVGAALLSATSNVLAGIGGPPVALWGENAGWGLAPQRATLQAYFLGLNAAAVPALGLPSVRPGVLLACVGALAAGVLLGKPLSGRTSERGARRATLALAGAGSTAVLVRALLG